jgi:hypothetical protein
MKTTENEQIWQNLLRNAIDQKELMFSENDDNNYDDDDDDEQTQTFGTVANLSCKI